MQSTNGVYTNGDYDRERGFCMSWIQLHMWMQVLLILWLSCVIFIIIIIIIIYYY